MNEDITKARVMFVIRCVWIVFALVIWIIALNAVLNPNIHSDTAGVWFEAGFLCLIPIIWPVIKFILRAAGVGFAVGSSQWDIDFSNGRIYNHGIGGAIITGIIAVVLAIFAGLIILPIYWIIYVVGTVKLGIYAFQKYH